MRSSSPSISHVRCRLSAGERPAGFLPRWRTRAADLTGCSVDGSLPNIPQRTYGLETRTPRRRFYIPEGAGWGKGVGVPVFLPFPAGVRACRKKGRGQGGGPGWTNDLDPGLSSGSRWRGAGTVVGLWGVRAPCAVRVLGQARGCVHPFGCARGWLLRGHGAGSRAGSGINQTVGPPAGRGPVKPAITRCPRPGLLTRPAGRRQPGIGPGRRAWRRRRR